MTAHLMSRSARTLGVVATVTAAIPLCLSGCAPASEATVAAAELRASAESDLLETPTEHVYEVSEIELRAPLGVSAFGSNAGDRVTPSGFIVVNDGVITEAELNVVVTEWADASFVLTEPTVLRREDSENGTVYATGTLAVNGIEQPHTSVKLTPGPMSAEAAEFDVSFEVPDNLLIADQEVAPSEVTAHLSLTAR